MTVANETVAEAMRVLYTDFAEWWKFRFPIAIVIFLTICVVGWILGVFVEKVLLFRLSDENDGWRHLAREYKESSDTSSWLPWKWRWRKKKDESDSTVMNSIVQPPLHVAASVAALPARTIWKGNLTKDGAKISGYLTMIAVDLAGAIIALEKANISMTPLGE